MEITREVSRPPSNEDELFIVEVYQNNHIGIKALAKALKISSVVVGDILKKHRPPRFIERSKRHSPRAPWNKGLTKNDDRVASGACSLAKAKKKKDDGRVYLEAICKRVPVYHAVWYVHHGYLPDKSKQQQIHHIDCDSNNNDIDNLLLTDVSEHSKIHKSYELVFAKLYRLGYIKFDKEKRNIDWNSFDEMVKKLER